MPTIGVDTTGASNGILTQEFGAITMPEDRFLGFRVAPILRGRGRALSVEWPEQTNEDSLDEADARLLLEAIPEGAQSKALGLSFTQKSDTLERRAYNVPVPDAVAGHWLTTNDFSLVNPALRLLATHVRNAHEKDAWTLATAAGSYAASHTSDPGNYNTTSTSLIDPSTTGIQTIVDDNGTMPTDAFIDIDVANHLILIDEVQAYSGSVFQTDAPGTMQLLEAFFRDHFGVKLHVHRGKSRSGTTRTSYFAARIIFADCNVMGPRPWLATLVNEEIPEGVDGVATVEEIRTTDPNGVKYVAEARYKVREMFDTAAYALTTVLS